MTTPLSPEQVARSAALRLLSEIGSDSPILWPVFRDWLLARCDLSQPEKYFFVTHSFPLLTLPWWFEEKLSGAADADFQSDLMYSSIALYYWIRLMDDAMDRHPLPPAVLAAMYVLPNKSLCAYRKYFAADHPFWIHVESALSQTADAVAGEFTTQDFTLEDFCASSARKATPALMPLYAVAYRHGVQEPADHWRDWLFSYLRWHQMHDDLLDWNADLQSHTPTFLLAEAQRCKRPDESVPEWIGREGYTSIKSLMDDWLVESSTLADQLNCPPLLAYIQRRAESFERQYAGMLAAAQLARTLAEAVARS